MADIPREKQTLPIIIKGGGVDNEEYNAAIKSNNELTTSDTLDGGGEDKILTVGTSAVELKYGALRKTNRKMVMFQALDSGISMGFSSSTQTMPIYKKQIFIMPIGENTEIWFIADEADKSVAIAEII